MNARRVLLICLSLSFFFSLAESARGGNHEFSNFRALPGAARL
jgi:hypothetical protein